MAHACRWERIPEEHYPTWQLDPENQAHKELIAAQKVLRKDQGATCSQNMSTIGTSIQVP